MQQVETQTDKMHQVNKYRGGVGVKMEIVWRSHYPNFFLFFFLQPKFLLEYVVINDLL